MIYGDGRVAQIMEETGLKSAVVWEECCDVSARIELYVL